MPDRSKNAKPPAPKMSSAKGQKQQPTKSTNTAKPANRVPKKPQPNGSVSNGRLSAHSHHVIQAPSLVSSSDMTTGDAVSRSFASFMDGHDTYLQTLVQPYLNTGQKIPFLSSATCVQQIRYRTTFNANAEGNAIVCIGAFRTPADGSTGHSFNVGSMLPTRWTGTINSVSYDWDYVSGFIYTGTAMDNLDELFPNSTETGMQPLYLPTWTKDASGDEVIPNYYSAARIVSAALTIESTATITNMQGTMTGAFLPLSQLATPGDKPFREWQQDELSLLPGSVIAPINNGDGLSILYRPESSIALEFANIKDPYEEPLDVWTQEADDQAAPGALVIKITGAAANSGFVLDYVANPELIPKRNTFNALQPTACRDDRDMVSHAFDRLRDVPPVVEAINMLPSYSQDFVQTGRSAQYTHTAPRFHARPTVLSIPKSIGAPKDFRTPKIVIQPHFSTGGMQLGKWLSGKDIRKFMKGTGEAATLFEQIMTKWVPIVATVAKAAM